MDMTRTIQAMMAGAQLSNIIHRLFTFRDVHRGSDLINLLNAIDAVITEHTQRDHYKP